MVAALRAWNNLPQTVKDTSSQVLNRKQLEMTGPDRALEGRIESFELAFRMQT